MDNDSANPHSRKINEALKIVLVDRMEEIALKKCYICDGFGHSAQVCPTAPTVRNIATLATLPKVKKCVTASIGMMKIRSFLEAKANWRTNSGPGSVINRKV